MNLFRIHAYEVVPQRLAATATPPKGGAFSADAGFKKSLATFLEKSKLETRPSVDFQVQPADGSSHAHPIHDVRSHVIDYTFGAAPTARASALKLAERLGAAMDDRSAPSTLLLLVAYRNGADRRLILWAFPKDEPLHFSSSGNRARLRISKDAFSRSSSFKKGALFEGRNVPQSFLSGRVIDRHGQSGFATAADYWVQTFLDCRYSLTGIAGTRMLARCLQTTHDRMTNQEDRDQISNAIVAVDISRRRQWSLAQVADEYLAGTAKSQFLANAPAEAQSSQFTLLKEEFRERLNFRVFRLEDDVRVSAPFGTIGQSVQISDGEERRLRVEGKIVAEKVRSKRHAS